MSLQVSVICELLPTLNRAKILITPVIGIVDTSFEPTANEEVSQTFKLRLDRFLSAEGHSSFVYNTEGSMIHFFEDYMEGMMVSWLGMGFLRGLRESYQVSYK